MRARLLAGVSPISRVGVPAGSGGFKLLLREIILTPGSLNRTNTLGAGLLIVRAIGGGSQGGIYGPSSIGDGCSGSSEGVGTFLIDKDSTLSGTIGTGAPSTSGTGTLGQTAGANTTVNVVSTFGVGTVIGAAGQPPTLQTSGPTSRNIGTTNCCTLGVSTPGGTLGAPGSGSAGTTPATYGSGGAGAGPYGGAGGNSAAGQDINGKAPGGGGAVRARDGSGIAYLGSGGAGGVILEWWG